MLHKKRLLVSIIVVIIATICILWFLTSSNQGTVSQAPAPGPQKAAVPTYKELRGANFRLRYLGMYTIKQLSASDNDLEIYQLTADTTYTKQLAIAVSRLPGGDLANNSAYLLRQSQPGTYTEQKIGAADVWLRRDGTEETAFLVHGERVATLAFTQQGSTTAALQTEVHNVLDSFTWE